MAGIGSASGDEYILTPTADAYTAFAARRATGTLNVRAPGGADPTASAPPDSLQLDTIFLNGEQLTVDDDGVPTEFPLPGVPVSPGGGFSAPPYSYGFFVLGDAGPFGAC